MATGTITHGDADGVFQWQIEGFTSLEVGTWYYSPWFYFAGGEWRLAIRRVCREGDRRGQRIDLSLRRGGGDPRTLDVAYAFSVRDRDGNRHGHHRNRKEFGFLGVSPDIPMELEEERMSDLVPGNRLTVLCHIQSIDSTRGAGVSATSDCSYCGGAFDAGSISSHQGKCLDKPIQCPECSHVILLRKCHECHSRSAQGKDCSSGSSSLLDSNKLMRDFRELFLRKEECDVVLKVQGKEFPAHKAILMARSPVLASALTTDMKERATGVVEIEDCDPSSFSDFLCYLYCGVVENLSPENVFSLFTTADKYDVQDLRSECLEFVKRNLSVDTFCDTITLALRHSETELIDLATDFFTQNAPQIIVTVKWQQFLIDYPTHSNELFIKFATSSGRSNK